MLKSVKKKVKLVNKALSTSQFSLAYFALECIFFLVGAIKKNVYLRRKYGQAS